MKRETEAIVTPGTSVIYPYYDETGILCSVMLKDGKFVRLKMSPTDVVDGSMKYFGSSFKGGVEGAKMLLGKINMAPVVISEILDMYMFPSKSPSSDDCVWFSLGHILMYTPIDKHHTKVILRDGTIFTIHCTHESFEWKHQRACMFKNGLEARTHEMAQNIKKSYKTLLIRRNRKRGNYEVSED